MTTTTSNILSTWQNPRRARSGDRFWILTDTDSHDSAMYGCSRSQQWFRVGAVDLVSLKLGYLDLSIDDVRALMKAEVPAAPWTHPLPMGIELTRIYHGNQEKGRFRESVRFIELEPDLAVQGPALRAYFERHLSFVGNSSPGMWQQVELRGAELRAIETAALSMPDWFSAGDVKRQVGGKINVTHVLAQMVRDQRLVTNGGRKRGMLYLVSPPETIDRADWT